MLDNQVVYDNLNWQELTSEVLKDKIAVVLRAIPDDVKTILDVGCGNGAITNVLGEKYLVTGIDRSEKALSFVKTNKIKAEASDLPFADNSFDLVFCSEVLEHLPEDVFQKTIDELKRVAGKYIMISVPFAETIEKNLIQCCECGHIFNRSYHFRNFTKDSLRRLFAEYDLRSVQIFGRKVRYYNVFLANLKHRISHPLSWIPYYWVPPAQRQITCPACEKQFVYKYRFNPLATLCDILNVLISPRKPYWLMETFGRSDAEQNI